MDKQENIKVLSELRAKYILEIDVLETILEEKRESLQRAEKWLTALKK